MKTPNKILSSLFVTLAPAAVVAALAGFSGTLPFGADLIGICAATVGLQLVAMADHRRRPIVGVLQSPSVVRTPALADLHVHPAPRRLPRRHFIAA